MPSTFLLTLVAMTAFAANSLLARLALVDGAMDVTGFTGVRLASGAVILAILLMARGQSDRSVRSAPLPGSWVSAAALFVYAYAFSLAYVTLGAALGALILFTAVQTTMIAWGLVKGERPGVIEWAGMALAAGGFVYLGAPGAASPDPAGAALMVVSGMAWGVYSLRGRGASDSLGATAGNFIRTVPLALLMAAVAAFSATMTSWGIALALASGIVASGLGYVVWYRVLPRLAATRAAIVQLSVPLIATLGGVVLLGEPLSLRIVLAGAAILSGLALAIEGSRRR